MPDGGGSDLPDFDGLISKAVESLTDPGHLKRLERTLTNAHAAAQVTANGASAAAMLDAGKTPEITQVNVDAFLNGGIAFILAHMVSHMLGVQIPPGALRNAFTPGQENVVGTAMGEIIMHAITGDTTQIEPGDEGAKRLIGLITGLTLNSWFEGIALEYVQSWGGFAHPIEQIGNLGHEIIDHLGLNRLMRVALRPLVDETIATPLRWKVNTLYQPSRLGASAIVRQIARGRWPREKGIADMAQQGYSPDRIEAMLNEAARFMSFEQSMLLVRRGEWTEDQVVQDLQNQGFDEPIARLMIHAYREARLLAIHDDVISTARAAYTARDIDEPAFQKIIREVVTDDNEYQEQLIVGGTMRELKKNRLSHSEIIAAVKAKILAFVDYRLWLERERYSPDDALTLELLLHFEINKAADLEQQRAAILAERQAAAADRRAAAEQRKAEVDAARALHKRGSLADLDRAAVRGLIPFSRVEEVLNADYDPDTVAILVGLLEDDRQKYLAQQQAAADAAQRAATRNIDVGALETSVIEGVLSLGEFRTRLDTLKFTPADADLLTATLQAKLDDRARAQPARDEAAARAAAKSIDLSRFEQLVRRGVRSVAEYADLLSSLGYDAGSVAAMVELLQARIVDDAAARDAREAAAAASRVKGATLEQMRRGVILGAVTMDAFQTFLVDNGWTADAQGLLVAELRDAVASADAARQKRASTGTAAGSPRLSVARLAQAARLGLLSPDVYQQALVDAGYSSDDVALEMDLLVTEIAAVQAARARRDALAAASADRGLSLEQLRAAVLKGVTTIDEYKARAAQLGYQPADVQTLVDVIGQELAGQVDATARRTDIAKTLTAAGITLDALDAAVRSGQSTLSTYTFNLEQVGVDPADAALLAALLSGELNAAPAAA